MKRLGEEGERGGGEKEPGGAFGRVDEKGERETEGEERERFEGGKMEFGELLPGKKTKGGEVTFVFENSKLLFEEFDEFDGLGFSQFVFKLKPKPFMGISGLCKTPFKTQTEEYRLFLGETFKFSFMCPKLEEEERGEDFREGLNDTLFEGMSSTSRGLLEPPLDTFFGL